MTTDTPHPIADVPSPIDLRQMANARAGLRVVVLSALLSFALPSTAQEPKGKNCELTSAPAGAGEIFFADKHVTVAAHVYPRLSEIPADYAGCQILWSSINNGPLTRSVTRFKAGHVVSVSPVPDGIPLCKAGETLADTDCTPRRNVVQVSYPAGCAARALHLKAIPKDCVEAFQAEFKLHDQIAD